MLLTHWRIFQTRVAQLGLWRTVRFTSLKLLRKALLPGVQFHFGMNAEDIVLLHLAQHYLGRKNLTYVDIGCHEARRISNSYLLYLNGSSGLAVDLEPKYGTEFSRERPNDIFVCAALSDAVRQTVVQEFNTPEVNTIDTDQAAVWGERFQHKGSRTVETSTLADLLHRHAHQRPVDVLLIDVEGHELAVLRGANLAEVRPAIIACEMHNLNLRDAAANPVVQYLEQSGYGLVAYAAISGYFVRNDLAARGENAGT